jgi:hypothetical protein
VAVAARAVAEQTLARQAALAEATVEIGLGRIVALCCRTSSLYHIR